MTQRKVPTVARFQPRDADGRIDRLQENVDSAPRLAHPGTLRERQRKVQRHARLTFVLLMLGCVLLAAAAGATGLLFIAKPIDLVRDELVRLVMARSGRELVIAGAATLSISSNAEVSMSDVSLSSPLDMGGAPTIAMRGLEAHVRLWPLLFRKVVVERLVLRQPVIDLRVDGHGRKSWDFADAAGRHNKSMWPPPAATMPAALNSLPQEVRDFVRASSQTPSAEVAPSPRPEDLELNDVRIVDGVVHYSDAHAGKEQDIQQLDARVTLKNNDSPLEIQGNLLWQGETVSFSSQFSPLRAPGEAKIAKLILKLSAPAFEAAYEGDLALRDLALVDGRITLRSSSVQKLLSWTNGVPAPALGPLEVSARVQSSPSGFALSEMTAALAGTTATGMVTIERAGARPYVKGAIKFSEIDVGRLISALADATAPSSSATAAPVGPAPQQESPRSIEDLVRQQVPASGMAEVRRITGQAGSSKALLDFSWFGGAVVDLSLGFDRLRYGDFRAENGRLTLVNKDLVTRVTIEECQIYEGRGRGIVTFRASPSKSVAIEANLAADGVSVLPLLKDAAGYDWLAGKGNLSLAIAGQGPSLRNNFDSLDGKAEVVMTEGAIVGFNIPLMIHAIGQGRLSGFDRFATEKTNFSELAASFAINNGIVRNQDLRILGSSVRLTGAGLFNLPLRQLDYTIKLKPVANITEEGGAKLAAVEIPVRIHGSFDKPAIVPDLQQVLKDPSQALGVIKELGNSLKGSNVEEAIKGLIAGDSEQKAKARDLLKQLLNR
jgi:AsmA protein